VEKVNCYDIIQEEATLAAVVDTLAVEADTLAVEADTLAAEADTQAAVIRVEATLIPGAAMAGHTEEALEVDIAVVAVTEAEAAGMEVRQAMAEPFTNQAMAVVVVVTRHQPQVTVSSLG
jgi:hypothetical protein